MSESRPERKRRLDTEHKEVRAALKKAKTIAAAAIKRMTLCGKARATALSIYMIANQELEPVIVYLRGIGRQRHWDEIACGDDVLTCCITDLFMQAADEELVSLLDPTNSDAVSTGVEEGAFSRPCLARNGMDCHAKCARASALQRSCSHPR